MPNRIIKESITTSPNFNKLSPYAEKHWHRVLILADDHGCFEATPLVVKGNGYPLQPYVRARDIEKWNKELEDCELVRLWTVGDRTFAQFTTFGEHNELLQRHAPTTPCPPWLLNDKGFDPRIATETLQAYTRISVAIKKLGGEAGYREIAQEAKCSMSTLSKYLKHLQRTNCYTFLQSDTPATDEKLNPNHKQKPNLKFP